MSLVVLVKLCVIDQRVLCFASCAPIVLADICFGRVTWCLVHCSCAYEVMVTLRVCGRAGQGLGVLYRTSASRHSSAHVSCCWGW